MIFAKQFSVFALVLVILALSGVSVDGTGNIASNSRIGAKNRRLKSAKSNSTSSSTKVPKSVQRPTNSDVPSTTFAPSVTFHPTVIGNPTRATNTFEPTESSNA